jgi:hypothetical protein
MAGLIDEAIVSASTSVCSSFGFTIDQPSSSSFA